MWGARGAWVRVQREGAGLWGALRPFPVPLAGLFPWSRWRRRPKSFPLTALIVTYFCQGSVSEVSGVHLPVGRPAGLQWRSGAGGRAGLGASAHPFQLPGAQAAPGRGADGWCRAARGWRPHLVLNETTTGFTEFVRWYLLNQLGIFGRALSSPAFTPAAQMSRPLCGDFDPDAQSVGPALDRRLGRRRTASLAPGGCVCSRSRKRAKRAKQPRNGS